MLKARPQRVCGNQRCEYERVVAGGLGISGLWVGCWYGVGVENAVITAKKTLTDANFIFGVLLQISKPVNCQCL